MSQTPNNGIHLTADSKALKFQPRCHAADDCGCYAAAVDVSVVPRKEPIWRK